MIDKIDNKENMNKIAIVAVGYNRLAGLKRLLESLKAAYYDENDVPLVISIDCSGDEDLYSYVRQFEWPFGDLYVNIQEERLGLKAHIYQCGDLVQYFKAIALFEDDLWVSPYFYNYLYKAVEKYGDDDRICEIALYRNERLGGSGFYFDAMHDGSDCFLWQDICTWGQCWTSQMWTGFKAWLKEHDEDYINKVDIYEIAKKWTRAWSKYFMAYEVDTHKYVLFPHESLTTNFNDGDGEHGGGSNVVQVNVLHGFRNYIFNDVDKMVKYDVCVNNESIFEWLPEEFKNEVCLDLYGLRDNYLGKRYVLSMKILDYEVVKEWGLEMRPVELNILYDITGKGLCLYDTHQRKRSKHNKLECYTETAVSYFMRGLNLNYVLGLIINKSKRKLLRELKLK